MLYVGARALCNSSLAPKERVEKSDPTPYGRLAADLLPFAGLITLVMGSLYLGFATPTEAAAVGVCLAFFIARIWWNLDCKLFRSALIQTVHISGKKIVGASCRASVCQHG